MPGLVPDKRHRVDVTIVMPCLNEAGTLPACIRTARQALGELRARGLSGEIVIADNGSRDASTGIARKARCRVVTCTSPGYGNAITAGCAAARGRYIVMGDADASYDFRESVPMVTRLTEGYDLCMGARFKGRIMPGAMPWKNRRIGNPVLTGILNIFFHSGLSDVHSGLRAFTKAAFEKMRLSSTGMEMASEMVVKATLLRLKRTEVPITLYPDRRGRPSHLKPWRDGWRHLKFLLMYSPLWLYFLPAAALLLFGGAVLTLLMLTPPGSVYSLGYFWIGDHWAIVAGGIISAGYLAFLFGMIAIAYHDQQQFLPVARAVRRIHRFMTVENAIIFGMAKLLLGAAVIGYVFFKWKASSFGTLVQYRSMVIATTLIVMGFMDSFAGFMLSLPGLSFPAADEPFSTGQPAPARASTKIRSPRRQLFRK